MNQILKSFKIDSNAPSHVTSKPPLYEPAYSSHNISYAPPHVRPPKKLQFEINELIVYPAHGVGRA